MRNGKEHKQKTKLDTIETPIDCRIQSRINRFVVKVTMGDKPEKVHINNTGRLTDLLQRGRRGFCNPIKNPEKLKYRLFAVEEEGGLGAIIDTRLQMKAFESAVNLDRIPWLKAWKMVKRNPKLGDSLLDYLFKGDSNLLYMEVKSAVMRENGFAMYPDCPSSRGQRHIRELIDHVQKGKQGSILFIAALPNVYAFKPYKKGDPKIYTLLQKAQKRGVLIKALRMYYHPERATIYLTDPDLDVELA
ncbi:MAG: DNA/RNA nuclease SfsA [Candidatus Korarchaeota archaeon]|nr:DNA/RNA nuclease SfsA [Candidatus Korarchaeota archaeon]NIU85440.1 DNA/RNA nuclease SfsA [Candidatus Thorarchaeota archaeon]NIW15552.1 DNA/RNA nuclease SfsA [Candidatus Thorarchaeota archaeon]NIW53493.1 DNA/RNA nuclease SfsA [Candidatus Korarchaeota archaeon]